VRFASKLSRSNRRDRRCLAFCCRKSEGSGLFGVSETNMRMFNIDAFIRIGQTSYFDANGSPFVGRTERHGQYTIKRLEGSLRVAEYIFVANFVPYRHLCRFDNVKTPRVNLLHQTFNSRHDKNDSNTFQVY
jgi:hypothetical protein